MDKISNEYIKLYRQRTEARLRKEYVDHQINLLDEMNKRDKSFELLKRLSYFLKYYNNNDEEMAKSRVVQFDIFRDNVRNVKKEQIELEECKKKLINKKIEIEEPEVEELEEGEQLKWARNYHKEVDELYTKYLKLKEK